ncbi:CGNR zinc finger domain-containing protein [Goodfellowiella coeruleoviolacea]|nr:CGNR zinc finger domain-containing protein [Goodfellowiella coeruleoviolacea]
MHFNPYGGSGAELAAALVNAVPLASGEELVALLREHDYKPLVTPLPQDVTALQGWAERLREVFGEPDQDRQVDLVNALLADATTQPYISRHDGRPPHLHYAREDAGLVARLRAFTAAGLAHLICQDGSRLGRCGRAGCPVAYVDTSRNGRRRFCSTRCANRVHVAAHRTRRGDG